jgi:hypothetical protein
VYKVVNGDMQRRSEKIAGLVFTTTSVPLIIRLLPLATVFCATKIPVEQLC